jgi:hypothetical protein
MIQLSFFQRSNLVCHLFQAAEITRYTYSLNTHEICIFACRIQLCIFIIPTNYFTTLQWKWIFVKRDKRCQWTCLSRCWLIWHAYHSHEAWRVAQFRCQSYSTKVTLRPMVSRPVCLGVRHSSGTRDQFFFFFL